MEYYCHCSDKMSCSSKQPKVMRHLQPGRLTSVGPHCISKEVGGLAKRREGGASEVRTPSVPASSTGGLPSIGAAQGAQA